MCNPKIIYLVELFEYNNYQLQRLTPTVHQETWAPDEPVQITRGTVYYRVIGQIPVQVNSQQVIAVPVNFTFEAATLQEAFEGLPDLIQMNVNEYMEKMQRQQAGIIVPPPGTRIN